MPDFNDQASDVEMNTLREHLAAHADKAAATARPKARGFCINPRCGEEFPAGDMRLFCDSRCAAEHQRLQRK